MTVNIFYLQNQNLNQMCYWGSESHLTCDANERNLYVSRAYRTSASFSPGFIVQLQKEKKNAVVSTEIFC